MAKKDKARIAEKAGDKPGRAWSEALETRLQRLEAALAGGVGPVSGVDGAAAGIPAPDAGAGITGTETAQADSSEGGRISLRVRLPGSDWRHDVSTGSLLAADGPALTPSVAARLAALGHPARLAILRAALNGVTGGQALRQLSGASTPGQFYHHLRELTAAGWLAPQGRGAYGVPPGRMGPLLTALALAQSG